MTDDYSPIRDFLVAAAREFNAIVDAPARASCASPIIDAAADKGALMPVQIAACFRTVELDSLFGPAVQSAAAGSLKGELLPLLKRMRKLQIELRSKAVQAEDNESSLPGSFMEKYCATVAELRSYIGDSSPSLAGTKQAPCSNNQKLKQPTDDAIACYRLLLATGKTQSELAGIMSRELRRPVDQPQVSRSIKQVKAWIKAGNVLPDLMADSGPKPKTVRMAPAKIDRGDGRKQATRPRRSEHADRDAELQRLIDEQQKDGDDFVIDPVQDEDD